MGPVLSLASSGTAEWGLTAVIVSTAPPGSLTLDAVGGGGTFAAEALWSRGRRTAYRYRFAVPLADGPSTVRYSLGGRSFDVALPARGAPPTMAYASCNGFSSAKLMKGVRDKNAMWRRMEDRHVLQPYNLLLMGGDQVYADAMWDTVGELHRWARKSYDAANRAKASRSMVEAVADFFFDLYVDRWSQPEVAAMLATVPMIAMWDDHDLMDGWGSYPAERQDCDVFQSAIWPAATSPHDRAYRGEWSARL